MEHWCYYLVISGKHFQLYLAQSADELNACLKYSTLWNKVKKLHLKTNMRVHLQADSTADIFSKQLLKLGNGAVPTNSETGKITLSSDFCNIVNLKKELVDKVFKNIETNYRNHTWVSERAILAAKNDDVNDMNNIIVNRIADQAVVCKSIDSVKSR